MYRVRYLCRSGLWAAFCAAAALTGASQSAHATVIDNFNNGGTFGPSVTIMNTTGVGSPTTFGPTSSGPIAGALGGVRDVSGSVYSTSPPNTATLTVTINGTGVLQYAGSLQSQGTVTTSYSNGGPFDLSNAVSVSLDYLKDANPAFVQGTLTGGGTSTTGVIPLLGAGGTLIIPIGSFVGGANLSSLTQVSFTFSGSGAADFEIDSIYTQDRPPGPPVPEPASLLIWSLVGLGTVVSRRRLVAAAV
jgi:hypothetical protein